MERPCLTHNMNNRGKSDSGCLRHRKNAEIRRGTVMQFTLWDIAPRAFADSPRHRTRHIVRHHGLWWQWEYIRTVWYTRNGFANGRSGFDHGGTGKVPMYRPWQKMRLLYTMRKIINPVIEQCGGEPLPLDETTVGTGHPQKSKSNRQPRHGSIPWGAAQCKKHLKVQAHRVRPIITINE